MFTIIDTNNNWIDRIQYHANDLAEHEKAIPSEEVDLSTLNKCPYGGETRVILPPNNEPSVIRYC